MYSMGPNGKQSAKGNRKIASCEKSPGHSHVEWSYYHANPDTFGGSLEQNLTKGHREHWLDGVRGVLIPDAPITRVEHREVSESCLESPEQVSEDASTNCELQRVHEASMETALAKLLGAPLPSSTVKKVLNSGSMEADTDASPAAKESSPGERPPRQQMQFSLDPGSFQAGFGQVNPGQAAVTPRKSKGSMPQDPSRSAPSPSTTPSPKAKQASVPNKTRTPKSKVKAAAKARGRPKKDIMIEVQALLTELQDSAEDDPCFWGSESKTQLKSIEKLQKSVDAALVSETDLDRIEVIIGQSTEAARSYPHIGRRSQGSWNG